MIHCTEFFVETLLEQKYTDSQRTCKEYPVKDETKQTEIQAHIFQKKKSWSLLNVFLYRKCANPKL